MSSNHLSGFQRCAAASQVAEAIKCRGMHNKLSAGIQVLLPVLIQHNHNLHALVTGFYITCVSDGGADAQPDLKCNLASH